MLVVLRIENMTCQCKASALVSNWSWKGWQISSRKFTSIKVHAYHCKSCSGDIIIKLPACPNGKWISPCTLKERCIPANPSPIISYHCFFPYTTDKRCVCLPMLCSLFSHQHYSCQFLTGTARQWVHKWADICTSCMHMMQPSAIYCSCGKPHIW